MKLKADTRFPHPVLAGFTDDFPGAEFEFELGSIEEIPATGEVEISGKLCLGDGLLNQAAEAGRLGCGIYITCGHTYFSEFRSIDTGNWSLSVGAGNLRGLVKLRAVVFVVDESFTLPSQIIHREFGGDDFTLNKHDLIGVSEEYEFEAGLDKLVPMESVFRLESNDSVESGLFLVGTDSQAIVIQVHPDLYRALNAVRTSSSGKQLLLSSLYLPCLVEILDIASNDPAEHLRWYRAIESRCRQLGVELDGKDLLRKAQILLNNPLGKVRDAMEALYE